MQLADNQWMLPELQMRRGVSYLGSNARLRKVVWDMMQGQRLVKVAVIGGSISWVSGGWLPSALVPGPSLYIYTTCRARV